MKEEGIDLAGVKPQFLSKELAQKANVLVTIGCNRGRATEVARRSEMRALMFPASRNWIGLPMPDRVVQDPKGKPLEVVRKIRDEIRQRVEALAAERNWL
jgi:arsenate reductase (thioredoxin)